VAYDRIIQYCTGVCGFGNDLAPEKRSGGPGSKHSGMYFLLPWRYRAGNFRRKLKKRIPVYLRNDWFRHCGNCLCGHRDNCKCHRRRRDSRYLIHPAQVYGFLCNLYGNCFCSSLLVDNNFGKEAPVGSLRIFSLLLAE